MREIEFDSETSIRSVRQDSLGTVMDDRSTVCNKLYAAIMG